jgi:NADH-quinone oxidoreductase subunit J
MQDVFFYIFAALTLGCGVLVVANPFSRNPVTSAMFLVLTIIAMAGLFVLLHAFFLAAVQVVVYAGAVIVLFLFVIMLLDVKEEQRRHPGTAMTVLAVVAVLALGGVFAKALLHSPLPAPVPGTPVLQGDVRSLGELLFTRYLLPFEVIAVLLLVAMVGVLLLSKKDLK